jgi:hypothetical protein
MESREKIAPAPISAGFRPRGEAEVFSNQGFIHKPNGNKILQAGLSAAHLKSRF